VTVFVDEVVVNPKMLFVPVNEVCPKVEEEWKDLCRAVVHRNDLELWDGTGAILGHGHAGGHVHVERPAGMSDEDAKLLSETLSGEMSTAIRSARRVRALDTLERVEALDRQLRETTSVTKEAVTQIERIIATAKSMDEVAEVATRWGPRIVAAATALHRLL
jgi:hypothetical protein